MPKKVVISSSFTAEPIKEPLNFWFKLLQLPFQAVFTPYNQVFQQMLDPTSITSQNTNGINIILLRLEDWLPKSEFGLPQNSNVHKHYEQLEKNLGDFTQAIQLSLVRIGTPHILCICPPTPTVYSDESLYDNYIKAENTLTRELTPLNGLEIITEKDLFKLYPVAGYHDQIGQQFGHIPYSPDFFISLATMLVRKINAVINPRPKVLVLDCDQTLWNGIVGEDGPVGITIDQNRIHLQEFAVQQHNAGMLICLCSKNNDNDVIEAFRQNSKMPLSLDHIVSYRINWRSKSDNIKALADELQLGLDSFIFLDDSPLECAEVQANCPEVTVLQLPESSQDIPGFLDHIWFFDRLSITLEDKKRSGYYKQDIKRQQLLSDSISFADFIDGLDLKMEFFPVSISNLTRVSQLTQRTNQFNFTTLRRSEAELEKFCSHNTYGSFVVTVRDKFGDYGLVGVCLFVTTDKVLSLDTLLLSCRALGRGIEHRMLAHLGDIAQSLSLEFITISFMNTAKNTPALEFLNTLKYANKKEQEGGWHFELTPDYAKQLSLKNCTVKKSVTSKSGATTSNDHKKTETFSNSRLEAHIANNLNSIDVIRNALEDFKKKSRPDFDRGYTPPRTPTETKLEKIWCRFLHFDRISITDNYFDLGGDSVIGIQIISEAASQGVHLTPDQIFKFHTIADQARVAVSNAVPSTEISTCDDQRKSAPKNGFPLSPATSRKPDNGSPNFTLPDQPESDKNAVYSLSSMQEGILFHTIYNHSPELYVVQLHCTIEGSLDKRIFEQAWQDIVKRHAVLRTCFEWQSIEKPRQKVQKQIDISFYYADLSDRTESDQENKLSEYLQEDRVKGFDLSRLPLFRLALIRTSFNTVRFIWSYHHIILDGWSWQLILQEVFSKYRARLQNIQTPLPFTRPFLDFVDWFENFDFTISETYWENVLSRASAPSYISSAGTLQSTTMDFQTGFGECTLTLSENTSQSLVDFAQQNRLTMNTVIQGCWALLLKLYTGNKTVIFGTTSSGRSISLSGIADMVGLFINTLPMVLTIDPEKTVSELFNNVQSQTIGHLSHEQTPLVKIKPLSKLPHDQELFDSIVVFENHLVNNNLFDENDPMSMSVISIIESTNYAVTVVVYPGNEIIIKTIYDRSVFLHNDIERITASYKSILDNIVVDCNTTLESLATVSPDERNKLVNVFNSTSKQYPETMCLHSFLMSQTVRTPSAPALVMNDISLSYEKLDCRSNQLAHYIQKFGVGPEVPCGVLLDRSPEMVVSLYAVLKAGGAYVPLEPELPLDRLQFIVQDTAMPVILTTHTLAREISDSDVKVICLESEKTEIDQQSFTPPPSLATAESAAYIIYTSGTTGKPKGVVNCHKGICNRLFWMQDKYKITENDVLIQKTPFSFDVSVWEFFWPSMVGARLVVAPPGSHRDSTQLIDLINKHNITIIHFVPSMLQVFLENTNSHTCKSLKRVICSGEALSYNSQNQFFNNLDAELHNLYGPTEAAVDVTYWECSRGSDLNIVPIGRPVANTQIYILDSNLRPVPVGVPGELHIGGIQVARGYLNRPELTREKFIPDPFSKKTDGRLYKTGDLARFLADGTIEYLGRLDFQVKIRGFRIELGEVEAVLMQHPEIAAAVVIAQDSTAGDPRLIAYLVSQSNEMLTTEALKEYLLKKLPEYMIPAVFMTIPELPISANGKIDRKALPEPNQDRPVLEQVYVSPSNTTEKNLEDIWCYLLTLERIGVNDNFFDLGGNSLLIVRVVSLVEKKMSISMPIAKMFQYPTIRSLAKYMDGGYETNKKQVSINERAQQRRKNVARKKQLSNKS